MKQQKRRYPKLRFKGFSGEWEQRKLGDYAKILTGGTPKTSISKYWEPKQIPWMSSGEVNKKRLDRTENMISEEGLNNSSARWVKKHSVLIALAGQGKTRGTVAVNNICLTTNQSIAAIVPNDNLYYEFIYQNLIKRYDELRMISSGDGTRGGLNKQIVSDVVIPSPSKNEQIKIGTFFQQLDNLITLHQRKLDNLKKLKKSYLQKLFPKNGEKVPKLRFLGFTDAWEQRKLSEVVDVYDGTHQTPKYTDSGIKFVSVENISNLETEKYISQEAYKKEYAKKQAKKGDILMTRIGDIGTTRVIEADEPLAYYVTLALLKPKMIESNFLSWLISSPEVQRNIWKRTLHIAFPKKINLGEINQIDIMIPEEDEQQKIGNFFQQLDNLITLYQRKLDKLKELKKAYSQKMFC